MSRPPDRDGFALLTRLREATAEAHLAVERHSLLAPLLLNSLTLEDYRRVLLCFLGYYRVLEQRLSLGFEDKEYHYHKRTPLLLRDLLALSVTSPVSPEVELPVPLLENREKTLGTLYVLEGATQGGRIIGPRVCRQLGLTPVHGSEYFHLFHKAQWPRYRIMLQQQAPSIRAASVEAGALEAFETLRMHMDAHLVLGGA